jgi:hypothetical protein
MYCGWKLSEKSRVELLETFAPKFPDIIAHHITLNLTGELPLPVQAQIVGYATDGLGIEALIAKINTTTIRPDGKTYHITWSLTRPDYKPMDSNRIISLYGFEPVTPINIEVIPFWVSNDKREHFE